MKDVVLMSPNNGQLVVGIPLFRCQHDESLGKMEGYSVWLSSNKPIAYAVDCGELGITLMNGEWVDKNLINLGEL